MELMDYQQLFVGVQKSNDRLKQLNFLWKLMKSPYTEYHYSLIIYDENSRCRAWAASSFMQMASRLKRQGHTIDERVVLNALHEAIEKEKDYFALGTYIIVLQEIANNNFRLSNIAADNVDIDKIEKAKKIALNFLAKRE